MGKRFFVKRDYLKGDQNVKLGLRGGEVLFRVKPPTSPMFYLTYDEALDLADALDAALDEQERDPLL